jgi:hypothetical protein
MAVRREPLAAGLAPVVVELLLGEPSLEEGARVHARRRVRLEIDDVARLARAEEVVEADLEEIGRRRIARDVPAELTDARFARTTIASAFQRTSDEMRDSISRLPW